MNYSDKISRLRDRRQGLYTRDGIFNFAEAVATTRKMEKYASISEPESVKYALGAMQRVDDEYTKNTYAEGNRVRDRLAEGLASANVPATFEYQGSVPLDVHVRGNSDIDLLVLHDGFVTVEPAVNLHYPYGTYRGKTATEELRDLRNTSIEILERRYYNATVDKSGSKSISLSGGSLKRVVDVVPSHWHDTLPWKQTGDIRYREIYILDSQNGIRLNNRPFMHIKTIADKCSMTGGSLRKVIRLLKNLRYDATADIKLSSYDIASISWHMTPQQLNVPFGVDLLLVDRARLHLKNIIDNTSYRSSLYVPDQSRLIFDSQEKLKATVQLYMEVEQLAKDIYKELDPVASIYNRPFSQVLAKSIYL